MASTSQEQSQTRRTISSSATVIYKFFLPVVWSGLFGLFTVFEFVQDHPSKWVQLAVWILGTLALAWFCVPLKSVQIAGADLVISNFFKATRVPLSQIDRVTENVILNIHPVRIHFERPTQFGWKITFMPTVRFIPFRSHPIVNELRELAEQEPSGQVALKAPEDSSAGSPSTAGQERSEVDKIRSHFAKSPRTLAVLSLFFTLLGLYVAYFIYSMYFQGVNAGPSFIESLRDKQVSYDSVVSVEIISPLLGHHPFTENEYARLPRRKTLVEREDIVEFLEVLEHSSEEGLVHQNHPTNVYHSYMKVNMRDSSFFYLYVKCHQDRTSLVTSVSANSRNSTNPNGATYFRNSDMKAMILKHDGENYRDLD